MFLFSVLDEELKYYALALAETNCSTGLYSNLLANRFCYNFGKKQNDLFLIFKIDLIAFSDRRIFHIYKDMPHTSLINKYTSLIK